MKQSSILTTAILILFAFSAHGQTQKDSLEITQVALDQNGKKNVLDKQKNGQGVFAGNLH